MPKSNYFYALFYSTFQLTKYKRLTKLTSINFRNKSTFIHCFSHLRRPFDHFVLPTFLRKMPLLEKFNSLAQVLWMKWRS